MQTETTIEFADHAQQARLDRRDAIDMLRRRINLLAGKDKIIMIMYFDRGSSMQQIARLMDVNKSTVSRRIRTLTKRLSNNPYIDCIRNREKITPLELELAREHFLRGLSMREIADRKGWTYYRVRETFRRIHFVLEQTRRQTNIHTPGTSTA